MCGHLVLNFNFCLLNQQSPWSMGFMRIVQSSNCVTTRSPLSSRISIWYSVYLSFCFMQTCESFFLELDWQLIEWWTTCMKLMLRLLLCLGFQNIHSPILFGISSQMSISCIILALHLIANWRSFSIKIIQQLLF